MAKHEEGCGLTNENSRFQNINMLPGITAGVISS